MGKRGQAAAEYLVLLAMIMIVALIGIVLLGGFGETGGAAMDSESKTYWQGTAQPFAITEWVQINDTMYLKIKNKAAQRIILKTIVLGDVSSDLGSAGWTVAPNSEKSITVSNLTRCNRTHYDYFSYDVTIYYETADISNKSQVGSKPLAGSCSFP